jgi:hypothetical protein
MPPLLRAVPADAWCLSATDPATLAITASLTEAIPPAIGPEFFRIELTEPDVLKFADLAAAPAPAASLAAATGGRVAFVADGACWGYLSLHRERGAPPFEEEELSLLRRGGTDPGGRPAGGPHPRRPRRGGCLGLLLLDDRLLSVARCGDVGVHRPEALPDRAAPLRGGVQSGRARRFPGALMILGQAHRLCHGRSRGRCGICTTPLRA